MVEVTVRSKAGNPNFSLQHWVFACLLSVLSHLALLMRLVKSMIIHNPNNYFPNGLNALLALEAGHTLYKDDCQPC